MKKILCICLVLLTLLSAVSCNAPAQNQVPTLENSTLGFTMSYPAAWTVVQNDVMIQICQSGSALANFTAFEVILEEGQDLKSYLADYKAGLEKELKNMKMENENLVRKTDHTEFHSYIYTTTPTEGSSFRMMQSFARKENRLAVLTLSAPAEEFAEHNKLFEAVLNSFRFTEKKAPEGSQSTGKITNDAVEYVLSLPEGWQLLRNDGMIAMKTEDGSTFNTGAFSIDNTVSSLVGYLEDRYLKELESTVGKAEVIGEYEEPDKIDGRYPAVRCEYRLTLNGTPYRFSLLLVSRAGYIYSFLYTATEENFALHLEDAQKIMASVSFTKG